MSSVSYADFAARQRHNGSRFIDVGATRVNAIIRAIITLDGPGCLFDLRSVDFYT
jgi:hypothetical protein